MREKIQNVEKITLYMTEKMSRELRQDAERFEAFSDDKYDPIMNKFLNRVLENYYDKYIYDQACLTASIQSTLSTYVHKNKEVELTEKLLAILPQHNKALFEGPKDERIPLKAVTRTDKIITKLKKDNNDRISAPICEIFASYLSLPMYERERIIFKKDVEILENACKTNMPLTLYLSSSRTPDEPIHVVPYKIVHGSDEMFNYLLCQSYSDQYGRDIPFTMRLCRISHPAPDPTPNSLKPEVIKLLDKMIKRSPQYSIIEDVETRVLLTKRGMDTYSKVSFGRPTVKKKDKQPDGNYIYEFNGSINQLYLYFRRFDAGQATILEPNKLAEEIKDFHEKALNTFTKETTS